MHQFINNISDIKIIRENLKYYNLNIIIFYLILHYIVQRDLNYIFFYLGYAFGRNSVVTGGEKISLIEFSRKLLYPCRLKIIRESQ